MMMMMINIAVITVIINIIKNVLNIIINSNYIINLNEYSCNNTNLY